jgi:hypothetical protein
MRGEIYKCPCGGVYFADPLALNPCPECKRQNVFPLVIKTQKYILPVHRKTKLFACHTEKDSDDFTACTAELAEKDGGSELTNTSGKRWRVREGDKETALEDGASVTLKKGMVIDFGGASAEIT